MNRDVREREGRVHRGRETVKKAITKARRRRNEEGDKHFSYVAPTPLPHRSKVLEYDSTEA